MRNFHFSQGSIRCLALGSDFLCCGGSDETVQVYGLRHRKKHGDLLLSGGCITALGAKGSIANGLLLVGDEHGSLQLFDVLKLELKKQLKGHKGAVTAISVHPNGELALSVSEDATLRLWDLNTCLCVFFSRLNEPAIGVQWHPDGEDYFILSESQLLKLSLSEGAKPSIHKADKTKYCCASWIGDSIAVGCRSGAVVIYPPGAESGTDISGVHSKRIKAITSLSGRIVTADSDGTVLCSSVVSDNSEPPKLVEMWRFNVEMRVNCLTCSTVVE
ncbi:p21-activated kinase-interacting 1, putative [Babesia ovata]|uniref:p21-activated kinase-interacting 1, putative n=1 Tax=Babesia ovata TaxID=189622 RepID=A0A2H6K8F0_9APIC|nr:p21-activated kinase-interacting 1, putative [Babesia ovata]GBE59277.1 p21-activated kinase-interacting 1, putative [Babesia ovata]